MSSPGKWWSNSSNFMTRMRTQQLHQYLAPPPQARTKACVFPKHDMTEISWEFQVIGWKVILDRPPLPSTIGCFSFVELSMTSYVNALMTVVTTLDTSLLQFCAAFNDEWWLLKFGYRRKIPISFKGLNYYSYTQISSSDEPLSNDL